MGKRFPRKHTIAEMFSKTVNTLGTLEDLVLNDYSHFGEYLTELTKMQEAYEATKRQRQLVDYDDLLAKLRELLRTDETARQTQKDTADRTDITGGRRDCRQTGDGTGDNADDARLAEPLPFNPQPDQRGRGGR